MIVSNIIVADEEGFSQAGVRVNYKTGKITINGKSYDVNDVQSVSHTKLSTFSMEVKIRVDDFSKPIHKVAVIGLGNEGEKFVQRLYTALRKAGGPSFY